MYCFDYKTNVYIAENVSAIFLCPDFTPESAPVEERTFRSFSSLMLLSGVTPADVLSLDAEEEYLISSELSEQIVSIAHIPLCADDHIACAEEKFSSDEVISVAGTLAEGICPMFRFSEHISSDFHITVCSREFYADCPVRWKMRRNVYCCSVRGFVPCGMELKIRIQNFRL